MRAITVRPGIADSGELREFPEPRPQAHELLVQTLEIGICGTDREILAAQYGAAPPGESLLVLGHESLGRVLEAPENSGFLPGDLVVGIVRHPDPVPCENCAAGEWDMCRNGQFTEHGIKELHGFARERYTIDAARAVSVPQALLRTGVLVEPASIIAKAWEHIDRIGNRACWSPRRLLVTGAGPVGLLAALFGQQRGLEVHVLDRVTDGPKPDLVRDLGAIYHSGNIQDACREADIVIECTGVGALVIEAMQGTTANGIVCLTGISSGARTLDINLTEINRRMVLENDVVFGSVNANRRHYAAAVRALQQADAAWLERLITRRVPLTSWQAALQRRPQDVKTVIDFTA